MSGEKFSAISGSPLAVPCSVQSVQRCLRPTQLRLLHSCDETSCVNPAHLRTGTQADNVAQMHARGRGRRRHTATTDLRGPAGRAVALRAALRSGWDPAAHDVALTAGDPFAAQLALL